MTMEWRQATVDGGGREQTICIVPGTTGASAVVITGGDESGTAVSVDGGNTFAPCNKFCDGTSAERTISTVFTNRATLASGNSIVVKQSGGCLLTSTDGGLSWVRDGSGPTKQIGTRQWIPRIVGRIGCFPNDNTSIIVSDSNGNIWRKTGTWSNLGAPGGGTGTGTAPKPDITAIANDASNPNIVFACTQAGAVYRCPNITVASPTWTAFTGTRNPANPQEMRVVNGDLYCVSCVPTGGAQGLFRLGSATDTTNTLAGATWTQLASTLTSAIPSQSGMTSLDVAFDGTTTMIIVTIGNCTGTGPCCWRGRATDGFATDVAGNWLSISNTQPNDINGPNNPRVPWWANDVNNTDANGNVNNATHGAGLCAVAIDQGDFNRVVFAGGSSCYKSPNMLAATPKVYPAPSGLGGAVGSSCFFDPNDSRAIYIGVSDMAFMYSTDGMVAPQNTHEDRLTIATYTGACVSVDKWSRTVAWGTQVYGNKTPAPNDIYTHPTVTYPGGTWTGSWTARNMVNGNTFCSNTLGICALANSSNVLRLVIAQEDTTYTPTGSTTPVTIAGGFHYYDGTWHASSGVPKPDGGNHVPILSRNAKDGNLITYVRAVASGSPGIYVSYDFGANWHRILASGTPTFAGTGANSKVSGFVALDPNSDTAYVGDDSVIYQVPNVFQNTSGVPNPGTPVKISGTLSAIGPLACNATTVGFLHRGNGATTFPTFYRAPTSTATWSNASWTADPDTKGALQNTIDQPWDITMDASGRVVLTANGGGTAIFTDSTAGPTPTISSISPTTGAVGSSVTITGTNFTGTTSVVFNGTAATFTVVSGTSITTTVPVGATTGTIVVTANGATATSAVFTVSTSTPSITSFTPSSGTTYSTVTITGTNFTNVTQVTIGGTNASFVVTSATQIVATILPGSVTGKISVFTTAGSDTSTNTLTVSAGSTALDSFAYSWGAGIQTSPKWWTSQWRSIYQDFMTKLAAKYDANPLVSAIVVSAATPTNYPETFLRNGSSTAYRDSLLYAGFTTALDKAAIQNSIDDTASAWSNTYLVMNFDPYETIGGTPGSSTLTVDTTYTNSMMDYGRTHYSSKFVLMNNAARDNATFPGPSGFTSGNYYTMYQHMASAGSPIFIQEAAAGTVNGEIAQTVAAAAITVADWADTFLNCNLLTLQQDWSFDTTTYPSGTWATEAAKFVVNTTGGGSGQSVTANLSTAIATAPAPSTAITANSFTAPLATATARAINPPSPVIVNTGGINFADIIRGTSTDGFVANNSWAYLPVDASNFNSSNTPELNLDVGGTPAAVTGRNWYLGGQTSSPATLGGPAYSLAGFDFNPTNQNELYIAGTAGIYHSTDGSGSAPRWFPWVRSLGSTLNRPLVTDSRDGNRVYIGSELFGFLYSADQMASVKIATDPSMSTAGTAIGLNPYVGAGATGVFVGTGNPGSTNTSGVVHYNSDVIGGNAWQQVISSDNTDLANYASNGNLPVSIQVVQKDVNTTYVLVALAESSTDAGTLGPAGGVFYSLLGSSSWSRASSTTTADGDQLQNYGSIVRAEFAWNPATPANVYLLDMHQGVWRSGNFGTSGWTRIYHAPITDPVHSGDIVCHPTNPAILYVATDSGVVKLIDANTCAVDSATAVSVTGGSIPFPGLMTIDNGQQVMYCASRASGTTLAKLLAADVSQDTTANANTLTWTDISDTLYQNTALFPADITASDATGNLYVSTDSMGVISRIQNFAAGVSLQRRLAHRYTHLKGAVSGGLAAVSALDVYTPASAAFRSDCEVSTDFTAVVPGSPVDVSIAPDHPFQGSNSIKLLRHGVAQLAYFSKTLTAAQSYYGRFYFMWQQLPNTGQGQITNVTGPANNYFLYLSNIGVLHARVNAITGQVNGANADISLYNMSALAGQWIRIEYLVDLTSGSTGSITTRLYDALGNPLTLISATPAQETGAAYTQGNITAARWGCVNSGPTSGEWYIDNVAINTAAQGWVGP